MPLGLMPVDTLQYHREQSSETASITGANTRREAQTRVLRMLDA